MLVDMEIDELEDLIVQELRGWTDDNDVIELYLKMYENHDYSDFEYGNIRGVVDNDYINNTTRLYPCDRAYRDIETLYTAYGCGEIYMYRSLNHGYDYIEAENNGILLVR